MIVVVGGSDFVDADIAEALVAADTAVPLVVDSAVVDDVVAASAVDMIVGSEVEVEEVLGMYRSV